MTIAEIVAKIRTAVYGRDVRENIAKGIETINDNVFNNNSDLTGRMDTLETNSTNNFNNLTTIITTLDTRETSRHNFLIDRTNEMVNKESNDISNINTNITKLTTGLSTVNTNITKLTTGLATANHNIDLCEDNIIANHNAFLDLRLPVTGSNLLKGTEVFDKAYWNIGTNVSIIDDIMGKLKGVRAILNNSCATQKYTFVERRTYILSAFVRTDKQHGITVRAFNALGEDSAASLAIQGDYNGNGFGNWWKYEWKFTATAAHAGEKQVGIYSTVDGGGLGTEYKLDVCAMQLQCGQEATPYMPSLKADAEQQPWQNVSDFQNGWVNVYGVTSQYYKDSLSEVHLRGALTGGTYGSSFILPPGYRPSIELKVPTLAKDTNHNDIVTPIAIDMFGNISIDPSGLLSVCLDGISFRAEQ